MIKRGDVSYTKHVKNNECNETIAGQMDTISKHRAVDQEVNTRRCEFRTIDYFKTYFLSGYAKAFRTYTLRIKKTNNDICIYYGEQDTAEHTVFACHKSNGRRRDTKGRESNAELQVEPIIRIMVSSKNKF